MALHFPITADNRQLIKTLEDSQNAVKSAMKNIEDSGVSVENMFHRIEKAAALSVAGFSLKGVIEQAIETRSYFEDIESSMKVFLGSQEKAAEFTKKLQDAAYYNMFEFSDLADASKQLIAYRNDVEDVIPIINKLSEVATATKTPLAEMVSLYNRAKSTGTVDSNAIQSWATKGVVLKDIMKDLGVVTAGTAISFDQLNMALDHITDEGGMFHGIMDAQMENLSANIGQLEDNLSLMFNDIGSHLQGVANTGIKAAGELVDHWQDALAVIATIATSYGVNKAVEVGGIAINKTATSYGYDVEAEALRALLPMKEEEEQSTLKQAVASGRLSEEKAKEIETLRQEADAQLEALIAKESAAKAEALNAEKRAQLAQEELDENNEFVQSCAEKLQAIMDAGSAEEIETAVMELNTAEEMRQEAANLATAASEQAKTAATNLATASTERESLATQINTAQTAGNTAATNVLAIAKEKLALAIAKVNKVIEANKFALITAAVIALGTAIYKLCTYQSEYQKSLEKVNIATNEATVAGEKEIKTLDELNAKLATTAKGSSEWKNVKDAIVKQFGQYIPQLDEEITKVGNLSTAYNDLRIAITQANAAKGLKSFIDKNDNTEDVAEKFREALSDWKDSAGKLGDKGKAILEPILREYAISSASDADIFSFVEDKLKQSYGVDTGGQLYQAYEYFLKRSNLKGFNEAHSMNVDREREIEMYVKDMGISKESYNQIRYGIEPTKEDSNYGADYKAAKEAYEAQKAEVEKMKANKADYTTKQYEEAVSALKGLKERYEKLGGQTKEKKNTGKTADQITSEQEKSHQRLISLIKSQAEERLRLEQEYEYQRWQNRIDLMEEGEQKTLAQMALNHTKELSTLEEQRKQAIEAEIARQKALFDAKEDKNAVGNKKYAKKVFDAGDADLLETIKALRELDEQIASTQSSIDNLSGKEVKVTATTDVSSIDTLEGKVGGLHDKSIEISVDTDLEPLDTVSGAISSLPEGKEVDIILNTDTVAVEEAAQSIESIQDREASITFNTDTSGVDEATDKLSSLSDKDIELNVTADFSKAEEAHHSLDSLEDKSVSVTVESDFTSIDNAEKKLKELEEQKRKLSISLGDIDPTELKAISERYDNLHDELLQKQKKAEQDRLEASKESMNAYLKEFGDYQEKRLAIEEEYANKISEAQNEGERMMLMAQRNKALSDLDYDEWVDTGAIALAFGDISKLSDNTVTQLISDMEKYREKVIATFDPEKIKKYEEALSSLRDAQSENTFGIFASVVPEYFKQRQSTANRMSSAGANIHELEAQRNALLMKKAGLEGAKELGANVSKDLEAVTVELKANDEALKKARISFQTLQEEWDQLNTPEEKFYALCQSVASASDLIGGLANQAADMADAIGAEGLGEALGYLGEAMGSVSNIASGFANGGLIGGIAAAAGEIMGWVGKIFSAGDNRRQKNIERLQEQIDALNKSYERLGSSIDKVFSTDASELIDQQNILLRQQQALIRQQMAEEEAKKKTDDEKMKQYREQLEEINELIADNKQKAKEAIIGEDLKSAINEFASLYAEAWNDGTDAAQKSMAAVKNIISSALSEMLKKDIQPATERFYDALAKAMEDGFLEEWELDNLDALKRQIDALASSSEEQYKMIQERYRDLDELKEDLTDISFDSVRDNFKSKLMDMKSTAKDFSNDFSDMLRNALIDGLMDEKYDLMLREWYDEFAEAMNDKTLTDSERDALRQQYDAIVQQGLADRDFINDIVGGGAYSQEASKGWSTQMTQDQGEELSGRFTAMVELEAINNSLVAEGNIIATQILETLRSLSSLSMVTDTENPTLREIRDMMFLSTGHLEDISKYTKQLITINSGIEKLNDLINKRL